MIVTVKEPSEIIIHNLEIVTVEQFKNLNHGSNAFAWIENFLIILTHHEEDYKDELIEKGIQSFRHVMVCKYGPFTEETQMRHCKIPLFNQTGDKILQAIIDHVKRLKS